MVEGLPGVSLRFLLVNQNLYHFILTLRRNSFAGHSAVNDKTIKVPDTDTDSKLPC